MGRLALAEPAMALEIVEVGAVADAVLLMVKDQILALLATLKPVAIISATLSIVLVYNILEQVIVVLITIAIVP